MLMKLCISFRICLSSVGSTLEYIYIYFSQNLIMAQQTSKFSLVTQSCPTLYDPKDCILPGFLVLHQLLEFAQTHVYWVSDAIQSSHTMSSPSLTAFNFSQHECFFQWVSSSHQEAKGLEFQLQHQSFQWIFRTDLLYDWLVWPHCNPKDSQESFPTPEYKSIILQHFAFFMVQLSHPYMITGKTIAYTRWKFVSKVMSLLFNMLSRLVKAFLSRSKCLLISWLQSTSAVIL